MASTYHNEVLDRLKEKGFTLPKAAAPAGNYVPFKKASDTLYISGQLPFDPNGDLITGLCGSSIEDEKAILAAQYSALNILAQVNAALDDFDMIDGLTKINGFVASLADYEKHPTIINGASDFLVEILGDRARHTRAAVGMSSLPLGAVVEVDAVFHLKA